MTGTIVTMPLVLPLLLPGVHANAWPIAKPLLSVVLPSLAAGLSVRACSKALAARLQPIFRLASNVVLAVVILVGVSYSFSPVVRTGIISAVVVGTFLFVIWFGIGFALGGPDVDTRTVLALGTTQRSVSIAFLVAIENFHDYNVVNVLAILAFVAFMIQIPAALALGTRIKHEAKVA
jgi:bile acid:Na+ symporter, BASS family